LEEKNMNEMTVPELSDAIRARTGQSVGHRIEYEQGNWFIQFWSDEHSLDGCNLSLSYQQWSLFQRACLQEASGICESVKMGREKAQNGIYIIELL
jgi:hypothetical protein